MDSSIPAETFHDLVRRIVEVAAPEKIILFGSAAAGNRGPDSDLDILVVKRGKFHRGHVAEDIYMNLIGFGEPVDVIVATPEDLERYAGDDSVIIGPALREGRVLYAG